MDGESSLSLQEVHRFVQLCAFGNNISGGMSSSGVPLYHSELLRTAVMDMRELPSKLHFKFGIVI